MEVDVGLICSAAGCTFSTPDMGPGWYPAMVTHLQVHAATKHGISMGGMIPTFAGANATTALPVESPGQRRSFTEVPSRSRSSRPRSSKRDNNLAFRCPDCQERSFATEAGLYVHRIQICGLRDKKKPTSLDYKCNSCPRAFTTPIGLASHRRFCQRGKSGSGGGSIDAGGDHAVGRQEERGEIENRGTLSPRGGARTEEVRGGSVGGTRDAAVQGRENQGAVENRWGSGSQGVQGEISGGSKAFVTVQNPNYIANVTGASRGFGSSGGKTSGETTGDSCSGKANTPRCDEKRSNSNADVSSSSKRSRSEVWVLAGRDEGSRDGEQETVNAIADFIASTEESGEVLEKVSSGLGRGVAYETPRRTTTGAASKSARRILEVPKPRSKQQRSQSVYQAPSGGTHQSSAGRSSGMNNSQDEDQGGVTMRVEMQTGQGLVIKIYRVNLTTSMQKVIDKVALKLGKRGNQVMLTKDGRRVDPTAMAAIYTNAKLVASEV